MTNERAIPEANKALRQLDEVDKTLTKLSKVLTDSELDQLTAVHTLLNEANLKINKIRGFF